MPRLARDQGIWVLLFLVTVIVGAGTAWVLSARDETGAGAMTIAALARPRAAAIPIRVEAAVELFSVIHRLAGTGQYDEVQLPAYVQEVWDHFGAFRDHPAVVLARTMSRESHINGNAPMDLAVHLTAPPDLSLRAPVELVLDDLDSRWDRDLIPPLLEAARSFARDTDFMTFFRAHQSLYDQAVAGLGSTLAGVDMIPWFQAFFGEAPDHYVIVLGLLNGSCNYGSRVTFPDGSQEFVSMLGALDPDSDGVPRYAPDRFVPTVVHEFSHSYMNPLVDRNREALRPAGEALFARLEANMHRWGYDYWYVMVYEYLVRASTIQYLAENQGLAAAEVEVRRDTAAGFPGTGALAGLLAEYEASRSDYPSLEDFLPRLADFFQELADGLG